MTRKTTTTKIYEDCRNRRGDDGSATIASKDVAKLIRARLSAEFPGTRFSVRSDYNSVNVRWDDGPCPKLVDRIVKPYSFGGFDGMIDLAYSVTNWLHPDGRMTLASNAGTVGSGGSVSAEHTDCPEPGAVLVKFGPTYVFTHRTVSPELDAELVARAAEYYGFEYDPSAPLYDQRDRHGDFIQVLARRLEAEEAEAEAVTA